MLAKSVSAEIQTGHLLNRGQKLYQWKHLAQFLLFPDFMYVNTTNSFRSSAFAGDCQCIAVPRRMYVWNKNNAFYNVFQHTHHAMSKVMTNGLQYSLYLLQVNIFKSLLYNHSLFLTCYTSFCLNPWKWRKNGPPKCCKPPVRLQYHNGGAKNVRTWVSTSAFMLHGFISMYRY
jgi:hypothetical protein